MASELSEIPILDISRLVGGHHGAASDLADEIGEACRGIGFSFGYNQLEGPGAYLSVEELVRSFVDIVSKNGNLLLNVGPMADGTIPEDQRETLRGIGEWMAANSEAIHGTTYGPLQLWGPARSTARDGILYLHVLDWPKQGQLQMNWFPGQVASVSLLADGRDLAFEQAPAGRLTVQVPYHPPDPWASVLVVQTKP